MLATSVLVVFAMMGGGQPSAGQSMQSGPSLHEGADSTDWWRWSLTQGGLTIVLLVVCWSYKKDLQSRMEERIADHRAFAERTLALERALAEQKQLVSDERIAFQQAKADDAIRSNRTLERLLDQTNSTLKANAEAFAQHAVVLARNTDSTHRLANAVERLGDEK